MSSSLARITFHNGLIQLDADSAPEQLAPFFRRSPRGSLVAPACSYADILRTAGESGTTLSDGAADFPATVSRTIADQLDPFDFQMEAISAWEAAGRRGIVVLPTGAGKSYMTRLLIARLGITDARCSTLVIVPTRVLLYQWHGQLQHSFREPIGIVGDDLMELRPITVTTYASARKHMPWFGNRWKLVVFDEVHRKLSHGPSGQAARCAIAPFRLGLTATPVESDLSLLEELVGPVVYHRGTEEMIDRNVLSVYSRSTVQCRPTAEEIRTYLSHRKPMDDLWHSARAAHRVRGSAWIASERRVRPDAVALAIRSVLRANRYWASIPSRIARLREILTRHINDRTLIFAESRVAAYEISRSLLIPAITADIGGDEREEYLAAFSRGECRALVTARALEEGVDLPEANVAVILAGRRRRDAETLQFIQRRGRVLRKRAGKKAMVYEISWSRPSQRAALP